MATLTGTPVSMGIAIGKAVLWTRQSKVSDIRLQESGILVCESLSPAEVETLDLGRFRGLVLERGGQTSHTAIMARTLGIPAVLGIGDAVGKARDGMTVVVDGTNGTVVLEPNNEVLVKYQGLMREYAAAQSKLLLEKDAPAISTDGHRVEVGANVGSLADVEEAFSHGADGIGVFRTELLYISGDKLPSEDQHFEVYEGALRMAGSKPVIIRALDIGGDKHPSYLQFPRESNPFLGLRGLRYCLRYPEVFENQLSACIRVARRGNLSLMLPMVSSVEEVVAFKRLLHAVRSRFPEGSEEHGADLPIGAMIEVPAAVEIIDELSEHLAFFSIGTNDLIQYMEAVDRLSDIVADVFDSFHPAIFRVLARIVEKAHGHHRQVGLCGEMAADPLVTPFFVGLGLDELSMAPHSIPLIKSVIRNLNRAQSVALTRELLEAKSSAEIVERLRQVAFSESLAFARTALDGVRKC